MLTTPCFFLSLGYAQCSHKGCGDLPLVYLFVDFSSAIVLQKPPCFEGSALWSRILRIET